MKRNFSFIVSRNIFIFYVYIGKIFVLVFYNVLTNLHLTLICLHAIVDVQYSFVCIQLSYIQVTVLRVRFVLQDLIERDSTRNVMKSSTLVY